MPLKQTLNKPQTPMKIKWLLFFLLVFGCFGYWREFFFVNLNNIMFQKYYNHTTLPIPNCMYIFTTFSYKTLYYSKYIYTLLWVLVFYALSYLAIIKICAQKKLLKYLTISYLVLVTLAAVIMAYGLLINQRLQDDEYAFSRWLLGLVQSPIICLILIASYKLYNKSFQHIK